jgi:CRISPR-associated endonuclease Cas2
MILVIYDIRSDKRRRKSVKLLESVGIRVQYSAFECSLSPAALDRLKARLKKILAPEDSVRMYMFGENVKVSDIGQMPSVSDIDVSGYISI